MVDLIQTDYELYISHFSTVNYPESAYKFLSYSGPFTFILSTVLFIFLMPFFFLYKRLQHGKFIVYIPVLHPWNFWIALYSKILLCPLVITVHEYRMHTGERSRFLELIQKASMVLSDKIVFLTKHEMKSAEVPINKSIIIEHPITDIPKVTSYQKNDKQFKVLFLGRANAYKGLEILQKSSYQLMSHNNIAITIAGKWSIDKLSFAENTSILDTYLTDEEMARLLKEHDILVLPYIEASQSGIISLGISSATPMILTRVGGFQEQLNLDEGFFIEPKHQELTDAIIGLSSNSPLLKKYQNALETKRKAYNTIVAEKINRIFESLSD